MPKKMYICNGMNLFYNLEERAWTSEQKEATIFIIPNDDEKVLYLIKNVEENLYWNYPNEWVEDYKMATFLRKEAAEKLYKELIYTQPLWNDSKFCLEIYITI